MNNTTDNEKALSLKHEKCALTILLVICTILSVGFVFALRIKITYLRLTLAGVLLVLDMIIMWNVRTRFNTVTRKMVSGTTEYERSGLFAIVWDEYEKSNLEELKMQFLNESNLKCTYIFDCKNYIDVQLKDKRRSAFVNINEAGIAITVGHTRSELPRIVFAWEGYADVKTIFDDVTAYLKNNV